MKMHFISVIGKLALLAVLLLVALASAAFETPPLLIPSQRDI